MSRRRGRPGGAGRRRARSEPDGPRRVPATEPPPRDALKEFLAGGPGPDGLLREYGDSPVTSAAPDPYIWMWPPRSPGNPAGA
jgi:hypothetical protein